MVGPRFVRAGGLNRSEQILADLADRSFLKLWTYPNLFMKQNHELTDLLVVFGDHVLIFSDKAVAYPETDDPDLNWRRFFKKAVTASSAQINRAEGWLARFPAEVFLDARCQQHLPLALPPPRRMRVHRICVAPTAAEAARARAGLPGLRIAPGVLDDAEAFSVGQVSNCKGWVHVFDEATLSDILRELSTTPDFIAYLTAKEDLMSEGGLASAATESDLLATYVLNERAFPLPGRPLTVAAGVWDGLQRHPQYLMGRARDADSALWDLLIDKVTAHYVALTLEVGNELTIGQFEQVMRVMASEHRFGRRVLSKAILQRAHDAVGGKIGSLLDSPFNPDLVYVLLIADHDIRESYAQYRESRRQELALRVYAAKILRPAAKTLVGIGLDAANGRGGSEDFVFVDAHDWNQTDQAEAEAIQGQFKFFAGEKVRMTPFAEDEFPNL